LPVLDHKETFLLTPTSSITDEVLQRGLAMVGHGNSKIKREAQLVCFRSSFGCNPVDLAALWEDLQTTSVPAAKVSTSSESDFANFLWCVHWLKVYDTEANLAGKAGLCECTVRKNHWLYAKKIQALKESRVVWPKEWESPTAETPVFLVSVNGVHCRVFEPKNGTYSKNPKFYSHKFHQSALCYEIAISVFTNNVVWVNGPFPAGTGDRDIFRQGLQAKIPAGRKAIADGAYQAADLPMIMVTRNTHSKATRKTISRAKARQEGFNSKLKNFKILSETFRHSVGAECSKHRICFEACVVICTYQIERSAPLFDV
jgi:hypothetical protein